MNFKSVVSVEDLYDMDTSAKLVMPKDSKGKPLEVVFAENKSEIRSMLSSNGALLFRGFNIESTSQFKRVMETFFPNMLPYMNQSTPRTHVGSNIYTATEYPSEQIIPMHNENSYCHQWPRMLAFFCAVPSATGGETPLADSRKVFLTLPSKIVQTFKEKQVMYARTYGMGIDLPWETVFQTENKAEVAAYCRQFNIAFEWKGVVLQTKEVCPAVLQHPETKEWVWFNQAHLFHVSRLDEDVKNYMLEEFGKENLPRHAYFGDGTEIPDSYLSEIRRVYDESKKKFSWQYGDLLLVDNLLFAHGRESFAGERRILVAMGN